MPGGISKEKDERAFTENFLLDGPASVIVSDFPRLFFTVTKDNDGVFVGGISVGGGGTVGDGMAVAVSVGGGSGVAVSVDVGGSVGVSVGGGSGVSVGGGVGEGCSTNTWVNWQDNSTRQASPIKQNQTTVAGVDLMDFSLPIWN